MFQDERDVADVCRRLVRPNRAGAAFGIQLVADETLEQSASVEVAVTRLAPALPLKWPAPRRAKIEIVRALHGVGKLFERLGGRRIAVPLHPFIDERQEVGFGGENADARMFAQQAAQQLGARAGHADDE